MKGWDEEKLRDYVFAYHKAYKERYDKRLSIAQGTIRKALSLVSPEHCYVSFSGGKDSTALAHLVKSIEPKVALVMLTDDLGTPGHIEYALSLNEKFGWGIDIIFPPFSVLERVIEYGIGIEEGNAKFSAQLTKEAFSDVFRKYERERNKKLSFWGIRKYESSTRLISRKTHGLLYKNNTFGIYVCTPLGDWDVWDVWTYTILNEIPIRDVYYADPEKVRCGWDLCSETRGRHGALVELKNRNPARFNYLANLFPDIKEFV